MTKILIINESCSDNIGDHAINFGLQKLISDNGYDYGCSGFDADKKIEKPHSLIEKSKIKTIQNKIKKRFISSNQYLKYMLWAFKNIRRIKKETEGDYAAVIIGGGQLIQSGGTFPIAMYLWTYFAKKNGKDIYILGVGCAEKFTRLDSFLYKKSFKRVNEIFVRDQHSINNLFTFFSVKPRYIPDLAYALYEDEVLKDNNKKQVTVIGSTSYYVYLKNVKELSLEDAMDLTSYISMWIQKARDELDSGSDVVLVSTTVQDSVLNKYVYEELLQYGYNDRVKHINSVPTTFEYINILKGANKVLSGRMHSLILGHVSGCSLATTNINKKIDQYMLEYSTKKSESINSELKLTFSDFLKKIA